MFLFTFTAHETKVGGWAEERVFKIDRKKQTPRQIVAVPTLCAVVVDVETIGSDCCAQFEKVSIVNRTLVDGQAGRKGKCEARSKTFPSARESAPVSGTVHQRFCRFVCFVLAFFLLFSLLNSVIMT